MHSKRGSRGDFRSRALEENVQGRRRDIRYRDKLVALENGFACMIPSLQTRFGLSLHDAMRLTMFVNSSTLWKSCEHDFNQEVDQCLELTELYLSITMHGLGL